MLVDSRATHPKHIRMSVKVWMSLTELMKTTASSAYMEILRRAALPRSFVIAFVFVAFERSHCRGSIVRMRMSGDNASPYLRTLPCVILLPGIPLRSSL